MPVADLNVGGAVVKVEVEMPPGPRPAGYIEDMQANFAQATDVVRHLAGAFTACLLGLPEKEQPQHAALTFALKISGEANWFIAKTGTEGSFQITLSWDRDSA
jgi:hypothetical protein